MTTYTTDQMAKADCEEIQDAWEAKVGDAYYNRDFESTSMILTATLLGKGYADNLKKHIFLPSHGWYIEKLMATGKWETENPALLHDFNMWSYGQNTDLTILELWQAFYMEQCHSKTWSGDKWC